MFVSTHFADKPEFAGPRMASQIAGVSPVALYRLALIGDVEYEVSPDRRPVFNIRSCQRLREKLVPNSQAQTARE